MKQITRNQYWINDSTNRSHEMKIILEICWARIAFEWKASENSIFTGCSHEIRMKIAHRKNQTQIKLEKVLVLSVSFIFPFNMFSLVNANCKHLLLSFSLNNFHIDALSGRRTVYHSIIHQINFHAFHKNLKHIQTQMHYMILRQSNTFETVEHEKMYKWIVELEREGVSRQ